MTPVTIRDAVPKDARALSVVGSATFLESFAFDHPGPDLLDHVLTAHSADHYRALLEDPTCQLLIVETPLGAPVGYAVLGAPDLPVQLQPDDIELKRIYLLGPWQGNGNGVSLMDRLVQKAQGRNAKRMLLAVYTANAKARQFYAKCGFRDVGKTSFMVGSSRFEDIVMAKPL